MGIRSGTRNHDCDRGAERSDRDYRRRRGEVAFSDNPAKGLERNPKKGRERYLTPESWPGLAMRYERRKGYVPWAVDESRPTAKHAPKPEQRRRV
jgi:hypothetical protein